MKKITVLFVLLLALLLCLASCGESEVTGETETTLDTEQTQAETETDKKSEPAKQIEQDIIKDGKALYRVVVSDKVDARTLTVIQDFIQDFYSNYKIQLSVLRDSATADGNLKEIIIGAAARPDSTKLAEEHNSYFDYGYEFLDNGNIVIYGYGEEATEKMLNSLLNGMSKSGKNTTYKGYNKIESTYNKNYSSVPKASFGVVESIYTSTNGALQVTLAMVQKNDFSAYKSTLENAGFTKHSETSYDASNDFATYKNDKLAVHISFHDKLDTMDIVIEKLGYLPAATAPSYTKKVDATLRQMDINNGMQYVIQLEDGSFIIIDGGVDNADDSNDLINYLVERNQGTGNAKPQVTWMFTHAHPDHTGLAINFIAANKAKFDLNLVVFNLIDADGKYGSSSFTDGSASSNLKLNNSIKDSFPKADIMYCHTGQTLYLAGVRIDTMMTHEDVYPAKITSLNSTSTIWKFTFASGKKFLVLGDTFEQSAEVFVSLYEASAIDSDIVQGAHHGLNPERVIEYVPKIYKAASPIIAMWPTQQIDRIQNEQFIVSNGILINDPNVINYYADVNHTVFIS